MTLEEQIRTLVESQTNSDQKGDSSTSDGKDTTPPLDEVSVTMSDGTVVSGKNYEEIARRIAMQEPVVAEPAPEPDKKTPYSDEEFAKRFVKSPKDGLSYFYESQYGFDPAAAIQTLAKNQVATLQTLLEREAVSFIAETPDYAPNPENRGILEKYVSDYNLPRTADGYRKAWKLAKVDEVVKPSQKSEPTGMPSSRRGGGGGTQNTNDALSRLDDLGDDDIEALFYKNREAVSAALGRTE